MIQKFALLPMLIFSVAATTSLHASDRLGPSGVLPPSGEKPFVVNGPGVDVVTDGGFEGGTPNASWTEASTNFGTPICDAGACGTGGGTGPNSGTFWTWFGGIGAFEAGSVSQMVTIPAGTASLQFFLEVNACDSATDYMEAQIDGMMVFRVQGDDPSCGNVGYVMQTVDVSAFADGGTHTLTFTSEIFANNGGGSNFFVDDVALLAVAGPVEADLSLDITNNATPPVANGQSFDFLLTASNAGPSDSTNAVANVTVSANATVNSSTCGATITGNMINWNIGPITASTSAVCSVNVTVSGQGNITASGTVMSDTTDPVAGNNGGSNAVAGPAQAIPTLSLAGLSLLVLAIVSVVMFRRRSFDQI